jgi:integrase
LSKKRVNNVLAVLSKALRYAEEVGLIDRARIRLFRVERPEIKSWSFEEYPRLLAAAATEGPAWYAAVCLAGEAGLRVGEVKALRWREDVDLVAGSVTVNRQMRHKVEGTPKGRTRRTIPMTPTLLRALKELSVVREGPVVREHDGTAVNDLRALRAMFRICRRAGLAERGWHRCVTPSGRTLRC